MPGDRLKQEPERTAYFEAGFMLHLPRPEEVIPGRYLHHAGDEDDE